MIRSLTSLFAVLAILGLVSVAQAELIVGTEPEGNGGFGVGFSFSSDANLIIGQQFSLSSPVVADSITLYLNGDGTDGPQSEFMLQVMNQIGPDATAANVLLTAFGSFPAGFPDAHAPVTFSSLGLPLGAGAYYLVVSSGGGNGSGWGSGANELPGGVGTIGTAFVGIAGGGAVATYVDLDPNNPNEGHTNFTITASVPEPASCCLLLSGIALFALRRVTAKRARG